MFGYILPDKPDLRIKEFEAYRGVYCSLCRRLGKDYGVFSRLILSYDCTFYAMVQMSLSGSCPQFQKGRCPFNPTKKCNYCAGGQDALRDAAALAVFTFYYKLLDDISDSAKIKALLKKMLRPFAAHWRKKALAGYAEMDKVVSEMFTAQLQAEKDPACSVDCAAHPTAVMLQKLMERLAKDQTQTRVYGQFGYYLGKWVYLIDAADDLEKDQKRGGFNPFVHDIAGKDLQAAPYKVSLYCNEVLNLNASMLLSAFYLMEFSVFREILENIVEKGMPQMQRKVLFEKKGLTPTADKAQA
ncbi:MAG TPA: hypothetical protein IAD32_08915 [Candidatus Scatavimonas merdigallinarum]|uniref:Uncharacterized protein n=1 Tax=Candidatus Scatavimonas merdigallinarum TaxID=2840914 RepID=A0A9D1CV51_9FIRM|nr:hypothetical protein [Candidatus Scatavimonas merdigallinarum]